MLEAGATAPTTPVGEAPTAISDDEGAQLMTPPKDLKAKRVIAAAEIETFAKGVSAKVTAAMQTRAARLEQEESLKKHREELRKERKRVARELRNHAKRRRRRVRKANKLSTQELVDVWHLREEMAPKASSRRHEGG